MLPVIKFPLSTFLQVGPVNVYLIKSHPYTLIDTGPNNAEALQELSTGLQDNEIGLNQIEQIILTHGHGDHIGMADKLQELTGAQIWIHEKELSKIRKGYWNPNERLLIMLGIPVKDIEEIKVQFEQKNRDYEVVLSGAKALNGGEIFRFSDFSLEIIFTPGHSPGSICLYEPQSQTLFSGDHLLPNITPNPLLESDGKGKWLPSASQYLDSLKKVMQKPLSNIYPGHGKPFCEGKEKAKYIITYYETKASKIDTLLAPEGQTVFQITKKMYPRAQGFELYLAVSKMLGILDLAIENGRLTTNNLDGVLYYAKIK